MEIETIFRLLKNSGFNVLGADGANIYLEDPSCIARSFQTFVDYAWVIISVLTAFLLLGWGISMIRGSKHDVFMKLRNLILILGVLSVAGPVINTIYGDDLFARGCRTITVKKTELKRLLDARKATLRPEQTDLYEDIQISDEKINEEIAKMAEAYKMTVEKLNELMGDYEKEQMKKDLAVQEAVTLLADAAKVTEVVENKEA